MRVIFLFFVLSFMSSPPVTFSQVNIDSLEVKLETVTGETKIELLNTLSRLYLERVPEQAVDYGKQALTLAKNIPDKKQQAQALTNIGRAFEKLSGYEKALEYYLQALAIHEALNDKKGIAYNYYNIGGIYWYLNNFSRSLEYYNRALKISTKINDKTNMALDLNCIGLIYWKQKEYEKALRNYEMTLEISKEMKNIKMVSVALNNMGIIYNDQKKYDKALDYYFQALKINRKERRKLGIIENMNNIGEVYINLDRFPQAMNYLQTAQQLAKEVNSNYLLSDNYQHLSTYYLNRGEYKNSLDYFKMYTGLKDSLLSEEKANKISEIHARFKIEQKEKEIRLLSMEQQLKNAKLKEQKNWLIFSISLSLIIFISTVLIFTQLIKKNKAYKYLVHKNMKIVEYERKILEYIGYSKIEVVVDSPTFPQNARPKLEEYITKQTKIDPERTKYRDDSSRDRYSASALNEEQKTKIMHEIIQAMERKKIYRKMDITIEKLADHLNVNRSYISQVINEKFTKSFIHFINEYRIREARMLLTEDVNRVYTIESVARTVGFHSTNAFNRAFKKFTGVTPSFFLKSLDCG